MEPADRSAVRHGRHPIRTFRFPASDFARRADQPATKPGRSGTADPGRRRLPAHRPEPIPVAAAAAAAASTAEAEKAIDQAQELPTPENIVKITDKEEVISFSPDGKEVRVKDLLQDEFDDVKFIETLKNCI